VEAEKIYNKLIEKLKSYHPSNDFSLVTKAYQIAKSGHESQLRKSGEPYLVHPVSVAYILAELELDLESIISGLLHDVIEDTKYTYEDLVSLFNVEIADIVQGVTKLDIIEDNLKEESRGKASYPVESETDFIKDKSLKVDLQAENYRKMFIAMAKDIRVILIKIADRLHNMRTLQFMKPAKQKEKAQETLDIYAPLAHRLGISKLRYELEDLSFKYLYPTEYEELSKQICYHELEHEGVVKKILKQLEDRFKSSEIQFHVDGRTKHLFSIFKKMKTQNKTLEQIFDIFAVRVIVDKQMDCYEVLGIAHDMYKPVPSRFKDYIGMPKPNMYRSIHTVVIGPQGEPVEIQIRTWEMHRTSEYGIAAHWKYKEGDTSGTRNSEEEKLAWLRQMLDWQKDLSDNDFIEALKTDLDIFTDNIYCFSPKGEIISLVKGATPIDFAYAIHSALGHRMTGAKVNGTIVPFTYELKSGDRIVVLDTHNGKGPSRDWISIVKTNQAKSKIISWFNKENREAHISKGKDALEKEIKKKGYSVSDILTSERKIIIIEKYRFKDWDSLCAAIGRGGVKDGLVANKFEDLYKGEQVRVTATEIKVDAKLEIRGNDSKNKKSVVSVDGAYGVSVKFSKCCSPLPGDEILGFITRGRGVSIHRMDCNNISLLDESNKHRIINTEWIKSYDVLENTLYNVDIQIIVENTIGSLNAITKIIADEKIPVTEINSKHSPEVVTFNIGISVKSKEDVDKIIRKISALNSIIKVFRIK
jgi:GTP diphosphokinase / guanosine-3',5'-bis(diphosphate) 3'-diphosphatase